MVQKRKKGFLKNSTIQKCNKGLQNSEPTRVTKKSKIIIRNLPFKNLSEKRLEEFFKEYGDIEEVKLLRKDDGKFVGCGFVQFKNVSSAAKAIRHANQREMSGRTIVVDWALPKKTFLEKVQKKFDEKNNSDVKLEDLSENENVKFIRNEKSGAWKANEDSDGVECGKKSDSTTSDKKKKSSVNSGNRENDDDSDGFGSGGDDDDDDDDDDDGIGGNANERIFKSVDTRRGMVGNSEDIEDGKTVFVRNIPFSATNEELKSCVECYGPIHYALICIDKLTEHSKGTGFVRFKDQESASQCIKDSNKIYLHDNPLTVTVALSRKNLEERKHSKKTVKDSRNLYLIREGIVIAGSKAATGVSAGDMTKRLQLEQWKNQILKNLNMFVSKTRLVIHNLPSHYDDSALRNLFMKYSKPKSVIKEAKVMYEKKKLDSDAKAASKEVGFVTFTNHEDALYALRNINNNPEIFSPKARPIVSFSIENKAVINSKAKRLEKSRAKLGINDEKPDKLSKLNRKQRRFIRRREKFIQLRREAAKSKSLGNVEVGKVGETESNGERKGEKRKKSKDCKLNKKLKNDTADTNEYAIEKQFTGVMSESGKKIKLKTKFRVKNQVSIHNQNLKAERRKRKEKERKKLSLGKSVKVKKGKPKLMDDANLSKLLKKHRESVQQSSVMKKWYDS